MRIIKRHKIIKDDINELYELVQKWLKSTEKYISFKTLLFISSSYTVYLFLDNNIEEFKKWTRFNLDLSYFRIDRFNPAGYNPTKDLIFDNKTYKVNALLKNVESREFRSHGHLYWNHFANLVFITRHKNYLIELSKLKIDVKDEKISGYYYYYYQYILALLNNDCVKVDKLYNQLIESFISGSSVLQFVESKLIKVNHSMMSKKEQKLLKPLVELYYAAYKMNEEEFNTILASFLKEKKKVIRSMKLLRASVYWIDYPALACCAYAFDRGINITVKSDYIPECIYEGELWAE